MQKISGIYKIQSLSHPERCYIGSAVNINRRWIEHLTSLKANKHYSKKLQNHYNKYGKNDLVFSILIGCDKSDLISTEQFFIDVYKPFFNSNPTAGSPLGRVLTEETKNKIRQKKLGVPLTDEHKQRCREGQLTGRHPIRTKEWNDKISKAQKGRKLTKEHKAKLRIAKIGYIPWNKGLVKVNGKFVCQN